MMKRSWFVFITVICLSATAKAQSEPPSGIQATQNLPAWSDSLQADTLSVPLESPVAFSSPLRPFGMYGITPFDYSYATWELHKGFNASIGLNVTFSPSRYAPS